MHTSPSGNFLWRRTLIAASLALGLNAAAQAGDTAPPEPHSDSVGAAITDTAITANVKAKLLGVEGLKHSNISVTTTNGVVTLSGTASSAKAKATAEQIASRINGVKSVDDQLQAGTQSGMDKMAHKTERVASDSWITTKVKSELMADSVSKGFEVSVSTSHGVVMLKGDLLSQDAIDHVKALAGKVKGVKSVDTSLLRIAGN
ncbi:hyperosmotically inducible protein [Solimonas aquatica]|uniref:Hyperosmotically inducible protein n=1 Tax=Solimonas aquatica TaxID=489703 RepID=A0A1H9A362_9GAMM|nr:BON domain-containing protein [Solimonas aquatica]SEP70943.1 hyperosmotically inducible protein [Solimonas aquatica]